MICIICASISTSFSASSDMDPRLSTLSIVVAFGRQIAVAPLALFPFIFALARIVLGSYSDFALLASGLEDVDLADWIC